MPSLTQNSLLRFIFAGSSAVCVDAAMYWVFLTSGIQIDVAKGTALSVATVYAYFINLKWTFRAPFRGFRQISSFLFVYGCAILINIAVNRLSLNTLDATSYRIEIAWFIATAASSAWNYVGLKRMVFYPLKQD